MTPDWEGLPVVVAGAGVSGAAAARVLRDLGARVTVVDASDERAEPLRAEGLTVTDLSVPPDGTALVVTSPGWRPTAPLLVSAAAAGIDVWGEVELAWRLRPPSAAPWLALTGTNGKTTAVRMLESVLRTAGLRAVAAGNVGLPLLDAVLAPEPYDVLAVELSELQPHWSRTLRPAAAAVLNVADDHTDWHGSFDAYARAKAGIWSGPVSIGGVDDVVTRSLLAAATGRHVGFTLQAPGPDELGVVEDLLVDRAFADVAGEATVVAELADVPAPGDHNVANALAAAALARAHGVSADAVAGGLRAFRPDPHRNALVAVADGVAWVDDSKATNPHAAAASLAAYERVVWLAGGLLKGADVDDLVRTAAGRLRAVVLLGTDRAALAEALARHAPQVPVVEVDRLDTGAMVDAVAHARALAQPGDTVLLAPAAASMDCFRDYRERGELFASAVATAVQAGGPALTTTLDAPATPAVRTPPLQRPLASYYLLLASSGLLLFLGLVMVFSASSVRSYATYGSSSTIALKQAIFIAVGLPLAWAASRMSVRFWRSIALPSLLVATALLVAVLVPSIGKEVDGTQGWIPLPGGFNVQPGEAAKLALALWGADLLVRKSKLLREWRHLFVPLVPGAAVLAVLIMLQPDMGMTVALLIVVVALLWVAGTPLRYFGVLCAVLVTLFSMAALAAPYRVRRLTSFLDPFADAQDSGFQAVQSMYAIASGGLFGLGLGGGQSKWSGGLPATYTDFIFAVICEELGLIGALAVLTLIATLTYSGVRIAKRTRDPFVRYAASAITAVLAGQSLINLGGVVGLLPITGITLPLVSFGGSSMLTTLVAIGILLSFARQEPGAQAALRSRPGVLGRLGLRTTPSPPPRRTSRTAGRSAHPAARVGGRR